MILGLRVVKDIRGRTFCVLRAGDDSLLAGNKDNKIKIFFSYKRTLSKSCNWQDYLYP